MRILFCKAFLAVFFLQVMMYVNTLGGGKYHTIPTEKQKYGVWRRNLWDLRIFLSFCGNLKISLEPWIWSFPFKHNYKMRIFIKFVHELGSELNLCYTAALMLNSQAKFLRRTPFFYFKPFLFSYCNFLLLNFLNISCVSHCIPFIYLFLEINGSVLQEPVIKLSLQLLKTTSVV